MENSSLKLNQLQAAKYEYIAEHICDWSENPRPFSTIAVMRKGAGQFVTADKLVDVGHADIFFIPAGSKYKSYWKGADGILYYAIHFHLENRYSEFSPHRFCLQKIEFLKENALLPRLEALCKYILQGGIANLKAYSIFYDLYADVLPLLHCEKSRNTALNSIKCAVEYIENNSDKNFPVAQLAQMCFLSESRFYAVFQRTMGCSPIAYRNNIRVQRATNLLSSGYTVEEIAEKAGFSSPVYFRRIFTEIMGKTPSEYRRTLKFSIDEMLYHKGYSS